MAVVVDIRVISYAKDICNIFVEIGRTQKVDLICGLLNMNLEMRLYTQLVLMVTITILINTQLNMVSTRKLIVIYTLISVKHQEPSLMVDRDSRVLIQLSTVM